MQVPIIKDKKFDPDITSYHRGSLLANAVQFFERFLLLSSQGLVYASSQRFVQLFLNGFNIEYEKRFLVKTSL